MIIFGERGRLADYRCPAIPPRTCRLKHPLSDTRRQQPETTTRSAAYTHLTNADITPLPRKSVFQAIFRLILEEAFTAQRTGTRGCLAPNAGNHLANLGDPPVFTLADDWPACRYYEASRRLPRT